MARRKLPTSIPPEVLLHFGQAASSNALALAGDARLLASSGRWSRATALMITAREEAGKGYFAVLMALGAFPTNERTIEILLAQHHMKQALGWLATCFQRLRAQKDLLDACEQYGSEKPVTSESLEDLLPIVRAFAEQSARELDSVDFAKKLSQDITREFQETAADRRLENLRQRALYTDVDPITLHIISPGSETETDYRDQADVFGEVEPIARAYSMTQGVPDLLSMLQRITAQACEARAGGKRTPLPPQEGT